MNIDETSEGKFFESNNNNNSNNQNSSNPFNYKKLTPKKTEDLLIHKSSKVKNKSSKLLHLLNVPQCNIIKSGTQEPEEEDEYTFCQSCDIDLIYPICISCIEICHSGHTIKEPFKKAKFKCYCGLMMHKLDNKNPNIPNIDNLDNIICLFNEWAERSKLYTYYRNRNGKPICLFCHNFCSDKITDILTKLNEGSKIPQCSCKNEKIHGEYKSIYTRINMFSQVKSDIISKLDSIQIFNLIFESKISFDFIYSSFIQEMNNFADEKHRTRNNSVYNVSKMFLNSNCYQSIINFTSFIENNKYTGLRYYSVEAEKNFFSFKTLQHIFKDVPNSDRENKSTAFNSAFWRLSQKLFFLFRKVYIGNNTQRMGKYKVYDLENMSYIQRTALLKFNKSLFPESDEISKFLINTLEHYTSLECNDLEIYSTTTEIVAIFKRLGEFNLVNNEDISSICKSLDCFFNNIAFLRKRAKGDLWGRESKLFYAIIKMLHYFIYNFNDQIIDEIINDKTKFPTLDSIVPNSLGFLFSQNETGEDVIHLVVTIMRILQEKYENKKDIDIYNKIMRHGMKILILLLDNNDSYIFAFNKKIKNIEFYNSIINSGNRMENEEKNYEEIQKTLESSFRKYYRFQYKLEDLIEEVTDIMKKILDNNDNDNQFSDMELKDIIKSNIFYSLSRVFEILKDQLNYRKDSHKQVCDYIFDFYNNFIHHSADNAKLLFTHYIFQGIRKAPNEYNINKFQLFRDCIKIIEADDPEIYFSKHILKITYNFLIKLKNEHYNQIEECLLIFLDIMTSLVLKIRCSNVTLIISKARNILIDLELNFKLISTFLKSGENEKVFQLYMKLLNDVYDFTEISSKHSIIKMLPIDKVINSLKNEHLTLLTRTELIRFCRKTLIDIDYSNDNQILYRSTLMNNEDKCAELRTNPNIHNFHYPTKLISFYKDLYSISLKNNDEVNYNLSCFDQRVFDLLSDEMKGMGKYIKNQQRENKQKIILEYYFEHGIILPVVMFLRKCFCLTHFFSGQEILCIYEFVILFLKCKIGISERVKEFKLWEEKIGKEEETLLYKGYNVKSTSIFKEHFVSNKNQNDTVLKYGIMNSNEEVTPLDYTSLFEIVNKECFSLLRDKPCIYCAKDFEAKTLIETIKGLRTLEKEADPDFPTKSEIEKRIIRLFAIYINLKESMTEELSNLFQALEKNCNIFGKKYRNILLRILMTNGQHTESQFAFSSYFLLFKLLTIQTTEMQREIVDELGGSQSKDLGFLQPFSQELFKSISLLFIDFINPNDNRMNINYIYSYSLIKIFKFLCEEHNNFFQGALIKGLETPYYKVIPNYFKKSTKNNQPNSKQEIDKLLDEKEKGKVKFFIFFLRILVTIIGVSKWENVTERDNNHQNEYLYDLFQSIIELLIEIIQGNTAQNLAKIGNSEYTEHSDIKEITGDLIDDEESEESIESFLKTHNNEEFEEFLGNIANFIFRENIQNDFIFQIRNHIMEFLISILEEQNCNSEIQKLIILKLNHKKVLLLISSLLKLYYLNKIENEHNNNKTNEIKPSRLDFDYNLYLFFKNEYFNSEAFNASSEFQLANILYRFIKLISIQNKNKEASRLLSLLEKTTEETVKGNIHGITQEIMKNKNIGPANLSNEGQNDDKVFMELLYIIKFFDGITQAVEVRLGTEKFTNQTVIFTILPQMRFLSKRSKDEFIERVDRESEESKKYALVNHIEYFQEEIEFYRKRKGIYTKIFASIDFTYVEIFSYAIAVALNCLMLFTMFGEMDILEEVQWPSDLIGKNIREGWESVGIINAKIEKSVQKWEKYYDILAYCLIGINGGSIILWFIFRLPLYYRLDRTKYMRKNKLEEKSQLTIWNKICIVLIESIYSRNYINSLIYMLIISLIGVILKRGEVAYAFLLLSIVNINQTLKVFIMSIRVKISKLLKNLLLCEIFMLIFSTLGFFFFIKDFEDVLDGQEDNYCNTLIFCFMSATDSGFRNRGGMGDLMHRISFMRHPGHYIGRIIYDDMFFFIIVIVMVDFVFGSLIKSFELMESRANICENDKKNHCFICHKNRAKVEKKGNKFSEHREVKHNIWNYVNYVVSLLCANIHDLNAVNSYVREKFDQKTIIWLPSDKDQDSDDEQKDEDENLFKVEEENVTHYVVKA